MILFEGTNEKVKTPEPFLPKCARSRNNKEQRIWGLSILLIGPKQDMSLVWFIIAQFTQKLVTKLDSMISLHLQRKNSPRPPGDAR